MTFNAAADRVTVAERMENLAQTVTMDGTRVISADAAREMRQITMSGGEYDFGLGWFVPTKRRQSDPPFVEHLGGGAGFFNVMRMYPSLRVGAVVMGNSTKYDIDTVANLAVEFGSEGSTPGANAL